VNGWVRVCLNILKWLKDGDGNNMSDMSDMGDGDMSGCKFVLKSIKCVKIL